MSTRHLLTGSMLGTLLALLVCTQTAQAEVINWRQNFDAAKIEAAQTNRLILLHFWTKSCGPCRLLEQNVFSQPQLGVALEKNYVPVKVDADLSPALASAYRIDRVPTDILLSPQGTVLAKLSCPGTVNDYITQLSKAAEHFRQLSPAQQQPQQAPVQSAYAGLTIGQSPTSPQQPPVAPAQNIAPQQPAVSTNPFVQPPQSNPQPQNNIAVSAPMAAPTPSPSHSTDRYAASVAPRTAATVPPASMQSSYRQAPQVAPTAATTAPPALAKPDTPTPTIQTTSAQTAIPQQPQITVSQSPLDNTPSQQAVSPTTHSPGQSSLATKMPAGSPPLVFDGCCPVTLKTEHKWVKGNFKFGAYHRGRTFLFVGKEHQQQFLANPDAYSPVFSGLDVVKLLEENQEVDGTRKFGFKYLEAFYLFSSKETMNRFAANPAYYAAGVRQAMLRMDADRGGTIRR